MPSKSSEALDRKAQKRKAKRIAKRIPFKMGISKTSAGYRRQLPRLPAETSKADLRAMLAAAVENTLA